MCVFILQTMSVESNFGKSLNKRFEGQESLPLSIRIANFHGTYADYLITASPVVPSLLFVANVLCSPSTPSSPVGRVGWKQSTQHYWPS